MTEGKIGRYEIRKELGEGGMGTVYLAHDPSLGREVALKVLHRHLYNHDQEFSLRFEQEARTIASLEHRNIVPIYEFGEDGDWLYFVMRFMKGGTLGDRLAKGPLSPAETATILGQVGGALDKAHRAGIIHRDLKPSNIMFDEEGDAYLGDFGIGKRLDAEDIKTRTGQTLGTPHYMSPEQVDGRELDSRSDNYALGILFYEMLTGNRPYDHPSSSVRVMAMHLLAPIPSLLEAKPDLPPQLESILQKAMAKEPLNRYTTANEMVLSIKAALRESDFGEAPAKIQPAPLSSQSDDERPKQSMAAPEPTPEPKAKIRLPKATARKRDDRPPDQNRSQQNRFLSTIIQSLRKSPAYWKAIAWHLFFGFGLFYVDRRLKRKWVYVFSVILILMRIILAEYDLDAQNFSTDIIPDNDVRFLGLLGLVIFLFGFIDVLWTCRKMRLKGNL